MPLGQSAGPRIDLLLRRASALFTSKALEAQAMECDLIARVVQNGRVMNFLYDPATKRFMSDDRLAPLSDAALRALAASPGQEITYTAATPGSGPRLLGEGIVVHRHRDGGR